MEWVETTARSVEEAKDAALDQLGVDEQEAEFEVVEEPRAGLFGRVRGEARVRARVAPKQPRPRQERGSRGRRSEQAARPRAERSANPGASAVTSTVDEVQSATPPRAGGRRGGGRATTDQVPANGESRRPSNGPQGQRGPRVLDDTIVPAEEQAKIIGTFLTGLLEAFDLDGRVHQTKVDDETVEIDVQGDDLALLIGPKGQTLSALHDLSRTVLQRQATGRYEGRVRIDVSGYRSRRRDALARFVTDIADQVRQTGVQKALEPMNSSDRKVVHDTVTEIEAVTTVSEGQDPHRRVVIVPDPAQ